jgi:hypothetical protein
MSEIEPEEDGPLDNADVLAAAAKLTEADRRVIDDCILSHLTHRYQKTAKIVALTMMELGDRFPDLSYLARIKYLAASGVIESVGNLNRMRFSEVRLPDNAGGPSSHD